MLASKSGVTSKFVAEMFILQQKHDSYILMCSRADVSCAHMRVLLNILFHIKYSSIYIKFAKEANPVSKLGETFKCIKIYYQWE